MMTQDRRAALLAYCRIDEDDLTPGDEILLNGMYDAAVSYMDQAGVSEPEESVPRRGQYDLCVNALVLNAWDRRDASIAATVVADNPAFRRLLNQLKLTEPDVSKLDTSAGGAPPANDGR